MMWYFLLYILFAVIIYLILNRTSITINSKKILSLPIILLISLLLPFILICLFMFVFIIFIIAIVILFIFGLIIMILGNKRNKIKKAKVVKIK